MKIIKNILLVILIVLALSLSYLLVQKKTNYLSDEGYVVDVKVVDNVQDTSIETDSFDFMGSVSLVDGEVSESDFAFESVRYYESGEPEIREVTSSFIAKILPNGEDYYIEENPGPSGDPHLQYFRKEKDKYVYKGSTAVKVVIPGNGFIYSSGSQDPFGDYSKYKLNSKGEIVEVKQPYYYSGVDSVAQKNFSIKNDEGEIVAEISKGSPATIVLVEYPKSGFPMDTRFLIKTQHNILGWYQSSNIPSCFNYQEAVMRELCWGGD